MEAYSVELDDLIRLHYLVRNRKVTTILELGVGKSTVIFNDALKTNKINFEAYVKENLRRTDAFECYSVDNYTKWINEVKEKYSTEFIKYCYSTVSMSMFNNRICTFYDDLPNICPDFIYIDGPFTYEVKGNIRGITTGHADRMPMSADVLSIEHFLTPGTLIVVDGRTANARFIKANLQRNWIYQFDEENDQHFFELCEKPLGIFNKRQIDFCLGASYYKRLSNI